MFNWVINRLIDILIVFALATLLVWIGAMRYPEMVPTAFYHYWGMTVPVEKTVTATAEPVSSVSQVQH